MPLVATAHITIPEAELAETFIRASGPGGQNVNKVASAVQLRFNVLKSRSLTDDVKVRLVRLAGRRLTNDGVIVIEAKRFRDQARNREDARARLAALIDRAATPEKRRIKTNVPRAAKKKRLEDKRKRGEVKAKRMRVSSYDD